MAQPHLAIYNNGGAAGTPIDIAGLDGGESSAIFVREIWNDKDAAFGDTITAQNLRLILLASAAGAPLQSSGVRVLDELWSRIRITHYLTADAETTEHATATLPFGTNAELPLPDLEPQSGVRIEIHIEAPGLGPATAVRLQLGIEGNRASSPLGVFAALLSGGGVVEPDLVSGSRMMLRGAAITADGSDTVLVELGQQVYDGVITTTPAGSITFDLDDGDAVALLSGESYPVTISQDPDGVRTVTKGAKADADPPALPAGHIHLAHLVASTADGIAVNVAPGAVDQSAVRYAAFHVRAGAGLTAIASAGRGVTANDHRQHVSHEVAVNLTATDENRIWMLHDGNLTATVTDAAPSVAAEMIARVTTDAGAVLSVIDTRRFVRRAALTWREEFVFRGALSQIAAPAHGLAWIVLHEAAELELVTLNLSALDGTWTAGTLRVDVRAYGPGVTVPFPAGGAGGASIYTADAQRPSLAFDAATLVAESADHITRRFDRNARLLLGILSTFAAPGAEPEQEVRVTLTLRRRA